MYRKMMLLILVLVAVMNASLIECSLTILGNSVITIAENRLDEQRVMNINLTSGIVVDNDVDVTCAIVDEQSFGSAFLQFFPSVVNIGTNRANVSFHVISGGSQVNVTCTAQSRNGGLQYSSSDSSNKVSLIVTTAAVIDIDADLSVQSVDANYAYFGQTSNSSIDLSVGVVFSERVTDLAVDVYCDGFFVDEDFDAVFLQTASVTATKNAISALVPFKIIGRKGYGGTLEVSCHGQSRNDQSQFVNATSEGRHLFVSVTHAPVVDVAVSEFRATISDLPYSLPVKLSQVAVVSTLIQCFVHPDSETVLVSFSDVMVMAGSSDALVPFEVLEVGTQVNVVCQASSSADNVQYIASTSQGSVVLLTLFTSNTVFIFGEDVRTIDPNSMALEFIINLSVSVEDNPVVVRCSSSGAPESGSIESLLSSPIEEGESTVVVQYVITSLGVDSKALVSCVAQSQNGGLQFEVSTSRSPIVTLTFSQVPFVRIGNIIDMANPNAIANPISIRLSEVAIASPVDLRCVSVNPTNVSATVVEFVGVMHIPVDSFEANFAYRVIRLGDPTAIVCEAESTLEGKRQQFRYATSRSAATTLSFSSVATVDIIEPSVELVALQNFPSYDITFKLSEAAVGSDVVVRCHPLNLNSSSYLTNEYLLNFNENTIRANSGITTGNVSFSIVSESLLGERRVTIECVGESLSLTQDGVKQYSVATSAGKTYTFTVIPGPQVNILGEDMIHIAELGSYKLLVQFTETIEHDSIALYCSSFSELGSYNIPMVLYFNVASVAVGSTTASIDFTVVEGGSPVSVGCYANSYNSSTQYLNATSRGRRVYISLDQPIGKLSPETIEIIGAKGQDIKVSLVISNAVSILPVIFNCTINSSENYTIASLSQDNIVFPVGANGTMLRQTFRVASVDTGHTRLVCTVSDDSMLEYRGLVVFSDVFVLLVPAYLINWDRTNIAHTVDPASKLLGECECDLTRKQCDGGCCCDRDCSSVELSAFVAVCDATEPPFRRFENLCHPAGYVDNGPNIWLYPIFCVVRDNNPSFGPIFYPPEVVTKSISFPSLSANQPFSFGVRDSEQVVAYSDTTALNIVTYDTSSSSLYEKGSDLVTQDVDLSLLFGILGVPAHLLSISSGCVDLVPVKFLEESHRQCSRVVDRGLNPVPSGTTCTSYSSLSALIYTGSLAVLNNKTDGVPLKTKIVLHCTEHRAPFATHEFYDCPFSDPVAPTLLPGDVCQHAVVDVHYALVWRGSVIENITATLLIADLEQFVDGTIVEQTFSVSYIAAPVNINITHSNTSDAVVTPRSGNPGYIIGLPLIFRHIYYHPTNATPNDTSDSSFLMPSSSRNLSQPTPTTSEAMASNVLSPPTYPAVIDSTINSTIVLPVWNHPNCEDEHSLHSTSRVSFGEDVLVGCTMQFTLTDFTHCDAMRSSTWSHLVTGAGWDRIDGPTHIGSFGNSNPDEVWDWVKILNRRTDPPTPPAEKDIPGRCAQVLVALQLRVAYTTAGDSRLPQKKVFGAELVYEYDDISFACGPSDCRSAVDRYVNVTETSAESSSLESYDTELKKNKTVLIHQRAPSTWHHQQKFALTSSVVFFHVRHPVSRTLRSGKVLFQPPPLPPSVCERNTLSYLHDAPNNCQSYWLQVLYPMISSNLDESSAKVGFVWCIFIALSIFYLSIRFIF